MKHDLNSLARTLAERTMQTLNVYHDTRLSDGYTDAVVRAGIVEKALEAVIREAIEKTLEAPILREAINDIPHVSDCDMQYMDGELDPDNCWRCGLENAIRSLKPVAIQK